MGNQTDPAGPTTQTQRPLKKLYYLELNEIEDQKDFDQKSHDDADSVIALYQSHCRTNFK